MIRIRRDVFSNALRAKGLTQADLAKILDVSEKHLSEIVNAKSGQTLKNFEKISNTLSVPLADLLDGFTTGDQLEINPDEQQSETDKMSARLLRRLFQLEPDLAIYMRDLDNSNELAPEDLRALADAYLMATGKVSKEIEKRVKKKSPHGEV